MGYTEEDASELKKEILQIISDHTDINHPFMYDVKRSIVENEILQSIRKKLKLTRSYHIVHGINSPIHGELVIQSEEFVENNCPSHTGYRLLFGMVESEDDEKSNVKFLTGKEIRMIAEIFSHILKNCTHKKKDRWLKVDMDIDDTGDRWYHYICKCGILQDVEIVPEA